MTSGRDDDALSWGDDDPTLDTGGEGASAAGATTQDAGASTLPVGWNAVGRGSGRREPSTSEDGAERTGPSAEAPDRSDAEQDEPRGMGNGALVAIGVLGGIFLLYAIGWLIGGLRLQGRYEVLVTDAMYQGALWLATAAPLIWFGTVIYATRRSRGWVRWAWLALGVLLLLPWPFIMIGAVGV